MKVFIKRLYIFLFVFISVVTITLTSACAKTDIPVNNTEESQSTNDSNDSSSNNGNSDNNANKNPENNTENNIENNSQNNEGSDRSPDDINNPNDNNEEKPTENKEIFVTEINIGQDFYNFNIYVGDDVELSGFDATIYFSDNSTQVVKLSEIYDGKLDTSTSGTKDFTVSYMGETFVKHYVVKDIYIISAKVNKNDIVVYYGEDDCLDEVEFEVTYSNGNKETFGLKDANIEIEWSGEFDTQAKANVTFGGFEFSFDCTVTMRKIKENYVYALVDEDEIFTESDNVLITTEEDKTVAKILHESDGVPVVDLSVQVTLQSDGKYVSVKFSHGGKLIQVELYAYKDKVVVKKK